MSYNFPGGIMKSALRVLAVLFITGYVMYGCKEKIVDDGYHLFPDPPSPSNGAGVLTANINGLPWAAEDIAGVASGTSTFSGNVLRISGVRAVVGDTADAERIDLVIDMRASNENLVPGTYVLGTIPAQEGEAQYRDALSCVCYTNGTHSGLVTITVLNVAEKIVTGEFSFDGVGGSGVTHMVSGGRFDVKWK
jgi:hypothetical protein